MVPSSLLTMVSVYGKNLDMDSELHIPKRVSVSEFKTTCLRLLEEVRTSGNRIIITKRGEPIAQVVPAPETNERRSWLGSMSGRGEIVGDLIEPACAPEEWEVLKE